MSDWPCGISTGCFYQTDIREILHEVKDGGFTMIEVCSFPAHLDYHDKGRVADAAARMKDLGLQANSFHAPFAPHIDIASLDARQRESSVAELLTACDAAKAMDSRYIVLHPGPEQEGRPPPDEWYHRMNQAANSLNQVAKHCREIGLILLLENMLPHLMFGHTSDMLFLLGAIRETNVGTCLDTGHAYLSGDLRTVVHKLSGHLRMLHVNDNRGGWDDHLPPGQGSIDWESLVAQLRHWNFRGTLILELSSNIGRPAEIMAQARQARAYLTELQSRLDVEDPGAMGW